MNLLVPGPLFSGRSHLRRLGLKIVEEQDETTGPRSGFRRSPDHDSVD